MKKLLLFLISVLVSYSLFGQSVITYSYDSAGNRTMRTMSTTNMILQLIIEPVNLNQDNWFFKRELGVIYCASEAIIFHNTVALDKQNSDGLHRTHEWNNIATLVNDFWLDTRRKLNVSDRNDEKKPTL